MVKDAGIDLVWCGIFRVSVVEMAQITPSVGFNLFVLQGHDILQFTRAAMPFFFLMLLGIVVIAAVPGVALWPVQWMVAAR